jgi:hypothetical protein
MRPLVGAFSGDSYYIYRKSPYAFAGICRFSISQFSAECRADAGKIYSAAVYGVDAYFSNSTAS